MCGTSTIGQSMPMPKTTAPGKTEVAGETGKGVAQGGGGTDIAAALAEISKQIEALKQILAGNSAVQGTSGGGAAALAESMSGKSDAMAGCNMGGGPGGKDSSVDGEHSGHDATQTGPGGKKDSDVDGTDGPGGKDTKGGGGDDAVKKAQDDLAAAEKTKSEKDAALKTIQDKIKSGPADIAAAEKAVDVADAAKLKAHKATVAAQQAVADARNYGGKYTTVAGDTWASIAKKYDIKDVDALKKANKDVHPTESGGKFKGGTVIQLPPGYGNEHKLAVAHQKLADAKVAEAKAGKALNDAIANVATVRAAVKAAKDAVEAAKKAAEEAQKAVDAAKKALADAEAAAKTTTGTDGGGDVAQTPVQKMSDELKAAKDKSFDERNAIFHKYFDAETDQAKKTELFGTFMETCSKEEQDNIMRFLQSQSISS